MASYDARRPMAALRTSAALLGLTAAAWADAASAQPVAAPRAERKLDPETQKQVENIIVTAQRRSERLQSVPVTITAFSGHALSSMGVSDTQGLQTVTPSLIMNKGLDSSAPFLRGVGSPDVTPSNEAAVATYLDGFYLISTSSGVFSLSNVDRVEVLKGPQGTLFGRNTTGGLIQIITRTPSDTPSGNVEVGYGNYDTFTGRAYLTGGLGGGFAADLAVAGSKQRKGWGVDVGTGREVNLGSELTTRGKLRWHDSSTDITAALLYMRRSGDLGATYQPFRGSDPTLGGTSFAETGKYNSFSDLPGNAAVRSIVPTLSMKHDFDGFSVVSLTSYQWVRSDVAIDVDGSPFRIANAHLQSTSKGWTQELQLVSSPESKIKWIAGLYGLTRLGAYDPATIGVPPGILVTNSQQRTTSLSAFGQATVPLGKSTNLTGGLRFSKDRAKASSLQSFNGFAFGPESHGERTYNKLSYRLSLDHKFSGNVLAYASYNRGFKAGLFALINYPIATGETQPEKIDAYEAGLKSDLLGNTLRINLAGFLYNYSNIQTFFFLNGAPRVINAKKARVDGAELEITYRPVQALTLRAGGSIMPEAKYLDFGGAPVTAPNPSGGNDVVLGQVAGKRMIRTPRVSGNLSATYTVPFVGGGNLELNGVASYTDKFFWSVDNRLREPAHAIFNASARVNLKSGWSASLWAKNIGNSYVYGYALAAHEGDFGIPAPPRTFGMTLGYQF